MKRIYVFIIAALSAALVLAGCDTGFTGTTLDTSALTKVQQNSGTWTIAPSIVSGNPSNSKDQIIQIDLGITNIDADTIPQAVTIYKLESPTTPATQVYTQKGTIPYTVAGVSGGVATLLADLTDASDPIEIKIDSTKLTANKGNTKMNLDGDLTAGEAQDDDAYLYVNVTGGTAATGRQRNPRAGIFIFSGAFFITPLSTTADNSIQVNYTHSAIDDTNYSDIFINYFAVEQYNVTTKTWTALAITKDTTNTNVGAGTYRYTFPAATAGATYRLVFKSNSKDLKTSKEVLGFIQKAVSQDNAQLPLVIGNPQTVPDATELSWAQQIAVFSTSKGSDSSGANKVIELTYSVATGSTTGDNGIDETTFTKDNVKIYHTNNKVFVPISSIVFGPKNGSTNEKTIYIYLDPAYTSNGTFDIYMNTSVRTLGDATPGITAKHFGDNSNINEQPYGVGFRWVKSVTF